STPRLQSGRTRATDSTRSESSPAPALPASSITPAAGRSCSSHEASPSAARDDRAMADSIAETSTGSRAVAGSSFVLLTLAAGQFLMTLDSSVMNVSIATVAKDVGTTVTGIQTAITAYTLVMAALMITGGKIGALIGRKRAFAIGCVIYAAGSFT